MTTTPRRTWHPGFPPVLAANYAKRLRDCPGNANRYRVLRTTRSVLTNAEKQHQRFVEHESGEMFSSIGRAAKFFKLGHASVRNSMENGEETAKGQFAEVSAERYAKWLESKRMVAA